MKHAEKYAVLLGLVVIFSACTQKNRVADIPVINFQEADERAFDVSEILQDPKFVRLETKENALIERAHFAIGKKYIIATSEEAILQFSADGAFIRVLVHKGRGPHEFLDAGALAMDENEQKLYIDHSGSKTNLLVYDLDSGTYDEVVKKPIAALGLEDGFSITEMMVVGDSLYCAPDRNYAGESGVYVQRTSGEFLAAFPRDDQVIRANAWVTTKPFLGKVRETRSIRYMSRDKDTLYSISGNAKMPYATIRYEDKFIFRSDASEMSGNLMSMLGEGPSGILFQSFTGTVKLRSNGGSASAGRANFYFTDKADFKPVKISRLTMAELEFGVKSTWSSSNDTFFLMTHAVDFKDMLRDAIESSSGNPEAIKRWQSLDEQVSEYDNPILLIGKIK